VKLMNCIFGTAGFAREVDYLIHNLSRAGSSLYDTTHFVAEDGNPLVGTHLKACPVISESEFFSRYANSNANCFIAVGSPAIKRKIVSRLKQHARARFPSLVDPSAHYDRRPGAVRFGEGAIICAMNVLTTDIDVGAFAHLNLDCTVGHDARIGDYSTVSPGVHISGNVTLASDVFVGTGAVLLERLDVCSGVVIGGGAVVRASISQPGTYVGVPAKPLLRAT